MAFFAKYKVILSLACGWIASSASLETYAVTNAPLVKNHPLRVVIRPRIRKKEAAQQLIDPESVRRINENNVDFRWDNILNNQYFSGNQDDVNLKKYGYTINSEMGGILANKRQQTDDPDNLLHLKEFSGRLIYSEASLEIIDPMAEIRAGCDPEHLKKCNYSQYGQHWLKANMNNIDISRSRADDALVGLLKSLE